MSPLNDNELNSLLEQAKRRPPEPSPQLAARALRAYRNDVMGQPHWRRFLLRPIAIPWPLGVLAAVLLVLIGALGNSILRRPSLNSEKHAAIASGTSEHAFYEDFTKNQNASSRAVTTLSFKEFQPVREIRPRLVGRVRHDQ